ncbi:hypothetical protein FRB99_001845 [Tulasnella sp. 403]|nr:hypothetical protein FRB99_001845 [Tulasnella sp. 403]
MVSKAVARVKRTREVSWDALGLLINLASKAQIPLVGGVFGTASEVIDMFNNAADNTTKCKDLLQTISGYAQTIWRFAEAMTPEMLKTGVDRKAVFAREAISSFLKELADVYNVVQKVMEKKSIIRIVFSSKLQGELTECSGKISRAHQHFDTSVNNLLLAFAVDSHQLLLQQQTTTIVASSPNNSRFRGLKTILPEDVDLRPGKVIASKVERGFWIDIAKVEVDGKKYLEKQYHHQNDDWEARFLHDIEWLKARRQALLTSSDIVAKSFSFRHYNLAQIYGVSIGEDITCLILKADGAKPLRNYLWSLVSCASKQKALMIAWKMVIHMKDAGEYILKLDTKGDVDFISTLIDSRVSDSGQLVVAPAWANTSQSQSNAQSSVRSPTDRNADCVKAVDWAWKTHFFGGLALARLKGLQYALEKDANSVISEDIDRLEVLAHATQKLRQSWTDWHKNTDRDMSHFYRYEQDEDGQRGVAAIGVGDIGYFDAPDEETAVFKRLTKVMDYDLGQPTVHMKFEDGGTRYRRIDRKLEQTAKIIQRVFKPERPEYAYFGEPDSDDDESEFIEDEEGGFLGQTLAAGDWWFDPFRRGMRFSWDWRKELRDRTAAWDYLRQNARRIGREHGVAPDDLVLVTGTKGVIDFGGPEGIDRLGWRTTRPLYFNLHLDRDPIQFYWSWRSTLLEEGDVPSHKRRIKAQFPSLPDVESSFFVLHYLQLGMEDMVD